MRIRRFFRNEKRIYMAICLAAVMVIGLFPYSFIVYAEDLDSLSSSRYEITSEASASASAGAKEFPDEEVPMSNMPKTGLSDATLRIWIYGLAFSAVGLGILVLVISSRKKSQDED